MYSCVVCKKGPQQGLSLFRINEKGQPGLWACRRHMKQTDGHIPQEVDELVSAIESSGEFAAASGIDYPDLEDGNE